jgi:hypothetical protein
MLTAFVESVTIKDTNLRRGGKPMRLEQQELEMAEVRSDLSAQDLWEAENYFRKQGMSVFLYDEPIDVFRFPKMAASPSVRRLQIGNGCRSVGTFTSEGMSVPLRRP